MNSNMEAIISLLLLHAGMPRETETRDDLSIMLWELDRNHYASVDTARFEESVQSIIDCLHTLNCDLVESRMNTKPDDRMISETLVYAISGIMRSLLAALREVRSIGAPREIESLLIVAAEQIGHCWDQFMAGDFEDLRDELRVHNFVSGYRCD